MSHGLSIDDASPEVPWMDTDTMSATQEYVSLYNGQIGHGECMSDGCSLDSAIV